MLNINILGVIIDLNQMYEEDGEKSEDTFIHLGKILKFN
jgi:hypothetical protein